MKKLGVIFIVVFTASFAGAIIAKRLQIPQFTTIERPLIDNLRPWNQYVDDTHAFSFSYPSYLVEDHEEHAADEHTIVTFIYKKPRSTYPDHPYIKIASEQTVLSLQDWLEKTYFGLHYCQESQVTCVGITVPTPIVLSGHTALQFSRIDEKYRDTVTVLKRNDRILSIVNHSTPEGTIPDATYEEMLAKMVVN